MRRAPFSCGTPSARAGCRRKQTGMALVLVLWVITLLAVIAASFTLGMRREAGTIRHMVEVAEARAAAEAGVRFAMLGLAEDDEELAWKPDGRSRQLRFGDATLVIRVSSESGRVDINAAPPELIDGVLLTAGMEDAGARASLLDSILDWRDPSPDRRAAGLSMADYRAAGLDYGPRNEPFLSVEELLLVPGMTPDVYRRLYPMVTVHSGEAGIDAAAAGRDVLLALPGIDASEVDAFLERREAAREQDRPDPALEWAGLGGGGGLAYSVEAVARMPSGLEQGLRVVLVPETDSGPEPFSIVHYRLEGGS
jgi:general secretion pathway protein K